MEINTSNNWQYQAAANIKLILPDILEREGIEAIAVRLGRLFNSAKDYNESIRMNKEIQPEAKLWLVIPSG